MKNQVSPPALVTVWAVPFASATVSNDHCVPYGEQALPVRSELRRGKHHDALALPRHFLHGQRHRRNRHVDDRVDVLGVVPARGNGCADLGFVLMIGEMIWIGLPRTLPPKSSTAMRAAMTEPWA